jgi:hypothetical protein
MNLQSKLTAIKTRSNRGVLQASRAGFRSAETGTTATGGSAGRAAVLAALSHASPQRFINHFLRRVCHGRKPLAHLPPRALRESVGLAAIVIVPWLVIAQGIFGYL